SGCAWTGGSSGIASFGPTQRVFSSYARARRFFFRRVEIASTASGWANVSTSPSRPSNRAYTKNKSTARGDKAIAQTIGTLDVCNRMRSIVRKSTARTGALKRKKASVLPGRWANATNTREDSGVHRDSEVSADSNPIGKNSQNAAPAITVAHGELPYASRPMSTAGPAHSVIR